MHIDLPLTFDPAALLLAPDAEQMPRGTHDPRWETMMAVVTAAGADTHPQHREAQMALHDMATSLACKGHEAEPLVSMLRVMAHDGLAHPTRPNDGTSPW